MSDYKDIICKPETLNWFKAALGMKITRDCLLDIVKGVIKECYDNIRIEIEKQRDGVLRSIVCNTCSTANVLPCNPENKCCNHGKCVFHKTLKTQKCPNNLCHKICEQIVKQHRFCNHYRLESCKGPTWINTDATLWCYDPWQIAKCYLSKDGYKDKNNAEETDFAGIINVIINCEYFQKYFKDDLTPFNKDRTPKENVATKARDVRNEVCHSPEISMTGNASDRAIDTLVALLQSLKHVDHQATLKTTVDKLTQKSKTATDKNKDNADKYRTKGKLKDGMLAITTEDVTATFEHLKENLIAKIKEALENDKDKLVKEMVDALNEHKSKALETIQTKGNDVLETVQRKGDDVLKTVLSKGDDIIEAVQSKGGYILQTVQSKGDNVLDTVQMKGDNVLKTVQGKVDDVLEMVQSKGDDVVEKVQRKEVQILEMVQRKGDDVLETVKCKGDDILEMVRRKGSDVLETIRRQKESTLTEIQARLIEQYRAICVVPVSMLDPDIDVSLERIYVPPSIKALKRGQDDIHGGSEMDESSTMKSDVVNCYKELLHRDGNPVNTIYIQGDPGCGKTTFSTKLVDDWCNAHSENGASTKKKRKVTTRGKASNRTGFSDLDTMTTSSKETSKQTHFSDLDTLRDYKFLFFVSLRDYSGTMCNVSQMVEEAIQSNKLPWDDSVWEDKCIVLTDAADEWYHPDPSKSNSACKCKDRSMPQFLQRNNITNIITARPWKLANLKMSDTSTRIFQISGVLDFKTLAENVINVLAEKDGISQKAQQSKLNDFLKKLKNKNMGNLMTIPAICVQLVHQYYVGRLIEDSLCSIYMNMLDMHIANGLQKKNKLQIEDFDTEEICVKEIEHIFETGKNEYMSANGSLIRSACALAFKTLTHSSKESSLVFAENTMTNHMTKTQVDYLLQTGIITKKKSLALSQQKNIPYMFVHKTIQEFLASMHIAINQTDIEDILKDIQRVYCDGESILDIGQLFIFTCGMCVPVAERMSKHMMDVITSDMESKLLSISDQEMNLFSTPYLAQRILLRGFIERLANKQPCLQLTLTHIALVRIPTIKEIDALNTLIDMNISNITSMDASFYNNSQQSNRVQEIISQSRESLSYLRLRNLDQPDLQLDLQGLKLKSLFCARLSVLSNLDCTYMRSCSLLYLTRLSERRILQSMSITGKNITHLQLMDVQSIDLLCAALPNLTSLHTLKLWYTTHAVELLYSLPESIRKVVYIRSHVSAQDVKSMVEWSKSRDACVRCVLEDCYIYIAANVTDTRNWMKQQDGIDITQYEFNNYFGRKFLISISWSTILSK